LKRLSLLVAAALAVVAVLAVVVASGGAQAPGARTLTFFESDAQGTFKIVDIRPKSPSKNPESRRFRFSVGDRFLISQPVLDRKGGKKAGTTYAESAVVKGGSFDKSTFLIHGVLRLANGQIVAEGVFKGSQNTSTLAVIGGAGAYEGARGSFTSKTVKGGTQDTVHLLP
jgi:hypothetical protein